MRCSRFLRAFSVLACGCHALVRLAPAAGLPLCDLTGNASFAPVHPQPADAIAFDVTLPAVYSAPPQQVLSQVTAGPGARVLLKIVVTPDRARFSDYEIDATTTDGPISHGRGTIGQLPAGQYAVSIIVQRYDAATGVLDEPCSRKTSRFFVYADDGLAPVVEYFHPRLDHYFMTQNAAEIAALDAGVSPGWQRTGRSFLAYRPGQTGSQLPSVRRYYAAGSGRDSHFFTIDFADQFALGHGPMSSSWILETENAFEIARPDPNGNCAEGQVPVYRLWNRRADSNHRYTTDRTIKAQMIAKGFVAEGYGPDAVDMCAPARGSRSFR